MEQENPAQVWNMKMKKSFVSADKETYAQARSVNKENSSQVQIRKICLYVRTEKIICKCGHGELFVSTGKESQV